MNGLFEPSFKLKVKLGIKLAIASLIVGAQWLLPSPFLREVPKDFAVAAELSEIRDRGYLIVAVKNNRAPLGFIDETGNLSGFEIDIAHRLAAELLGDSSAIKFVPVSNVDRLNAVLADQVDIAIAAITLTEMRSRITNFSDPYYLDGAAFITQDPNIQRLSDLRTRTIAVLDRSSTVFHVRFILPGAQLVGVNSYAEGRRLLANGEVDAFAGDASVLAGWAREPRAEVYRILPDILSAEPLAIALPKGQQYDELQTEINRSVRNWYTEGWLQSRAAYWGLPAESAQFVDLAPDSILPSEP